MDKDLLFDVPPHIQEVLDRRSDAIFSSIFELFCYDDPEQVSLIDILNRLMLLLQTSAMFVLAEYDPATKTIKGEEGSYINFNPYPEHQEKIKEAIKKATKGKAFFKIFGIENRRLLVFLSNQDKVPTGDLAYSFSVLSEKSYKKSDKTHRDHRIFSYLLTKVLNGAEYRNRFGNNFLLNAQHVVNKCSGFKIEQKNITIPDKEYKQFHLDFINGLEKDYHGYGMKHGGVIDKVYRKSEKSLRMISGNSDNRSISSHDLANFLFFLRDYSGETQRSHPIYSYGLRVLICSKQEEHIRRYFQYLRDNKDLKHLKNWYTDKILTKGNTDYKNIGKAVNDAFWGKIENGNFDYLIRILKTRFRNATYSMSDPVFSGIIHFRNPCVNGGLHRSLPEDKRNYSYGQLEDVDIEELLRLVIVHYLFLGMARSSGSDLNNNFMVMLCPVSIGGRIIGVMGYVTSNTNKKNLNDIKVHEYSYSWRQNFHVYSSLHNRFKRNLRAKFWQFYVRTVFNMYVNTLRDMNTQEYIANESDDKTRGKKIISYMEKNMNRRLGFLTRFFGYSGICVNYYSNENKKILHFPNDEVRFPNAKKINYANAIGRFHLELNFIDGSKEDEPCSFFPQYGDKERLKKFVDITEIAIAISDRSLGYKRLDSN